MNALASINELRTALSISRRIVAPVETHHRSARNKEKYFRFSIECLLYDGVRSAYNRMSTKRPSKMVANKLCLVS